MFTHCTSRYALALTCVLSLLTSTLFASTAGISSYLYMNGVYAHPPAPRLRTGGLALADFNADGTIEASVPGVHIAGFAVISGTTVVWFGAGAWPVAIAAADLNADSLVDLAVVEQHANGVAVYTNDGLGGFTRTGFYPTGMDPQAIVPVDLDRNGRLDLVVANRTAGTVSVLFSTGSAFLFGQTIAVSGEPNALAAADFDGDGRIDIAVAGAAEDAVKVLRNAGGVLVPAGVFEGGPYPVAVAAADLNGDGYTDLAVADREAPQVTVLLNDGTGRFVARDVLLVEPGYGPFEPPADVQLVDMNGDGAIDIRCAAKTLLNDGAASFTITSGPASATNMVYARAQIPAEPYPFLGSIVTAPYIGKIEAVYQSPPPAPAVPGDITRDGACDVEDLLTLAASWSRTVGETGFLPAADLSGDARCDVTDLLLLAAGWGV